MFFKKKKVKFLGRAGIIFNHGGVDYYVDSEMLDGKKYDLVVYTDTVRRKDSSEIVTGALKGKVLKSLIDYLKDRENLRVDLYPASN